MDTQSQDRLEGKQIRFGDESPAGTAGDRPLPCLFNDNSDNYSVNGLSETAKIERKKWCPLTSSQKKNAHAVMSNVCHVVEQFGVERCGFLTITFGAQGGLLTFRETQRRVNNFVRRHLGELFPVRIRVVEFQRSGMPHYHLLVVCSGDVRTGFDFDFYDEMRHYWSVGRKSGLARPQGTLGRNELLVSLHERLRQHGPCYGVGRMELVPIRSCGVAVGRYIGGYMAKGVPAKTDEHKGVRFVSYSKEVDRVYKGAFAWVEFGREWRAKLGKWAAQYGCESMEDVTRMFGPRWAHKYREIIMGLEIESVKSVVPVEGPSPKLDNRYHQMVAIIRARRSEFLQMNESGSATEI